MLNCAHWVVEAYRQRMTTKEWKTILLDSGDKIIVHGNLRQLKAESLGHGVVEVFKEVLK